MHNQYSDRIYAILLLVIIEYIKTTDYLGSIIDLQYCRSKHKFLLLILLLYSAKYPIVLLMIIFALYFFQSMS